MKEITFYAGPLHDKKEFIPEEQKTYSVKVVLESRTLGYNETYFHYAEKEEGSLIFVPTHTTKTNQPNPQTTNYLPS